MITTLNIERTYETVTAYGGRPYFDLTGGRTTLSDKPIRYRWIGKCRCGSARKLEGALVHAWTGRSSDFVIEAADGHYLAGANGTDASFVRVRCTCGLWFPVKRVTEGKKHSKHECNAKCLASTGPNCDCRCRGANHGSSL